jgi:nucleoside 2-deoxyribosyltransferase
MTMSNAERWAVLAAEARDATGGTPVAYVAGPYRDARGEWYVEQNRRVAEDAALMLRGAGWACVVPHRNSGGMDGALPDEVWLREGLALLRRCDVVVVVGEYWTSEGTALEVNEAVARGVPVYRVDASRV